MAAEGNDAQALLNLGQCYFSGRGVRQDYALAIASWERSAERQNQSAIWRLAMIHAAGEEVPRDRKRAEALCRLLAERGHVNGILLLGELRYLEGDHRGASQWWTKAADRGSTQARALLELSKWRRQEPVPGVRAYVDVIHFYQGRNNCGATSVAVFARQAGTGVNPYAVKRDENGEIRYSGHTLLVVGYNMDLDQIVLKNPHQPSPGIELLSAAELKANSYSGGYSRSSKPERFSEATRIG